MRSRELELRLRKVCGIQGFKTTYRNNRLKSHHQSLAHRSTGLPDNLAYKYLRIMAVKAESFP